MKYVHSIDTDTPKPGQYTITYEDKSFEVIDREEFMITNLRFSSRTEEEFDQQIKKEITGFTFRPSFLKRMWRK